MSTTGLDVFDRTVQKSNGWLKELQGDPHWDDRHRTYRKRPPTSGHSSPCC